MHPFLAHYLGGAGCEGPGTTGAWNSFTGTSNGWQDVAFDLTRFAGGQVELRISYVTDPASGGIGAFVDDTRVVINGATDADGFEGSSSWAIGGPPPGSPRRTPATGRSAARWSSSVAGVSTEDTLLLGFGLEQLATQDDRARLLSQALGGLLGE